MTQKIKFYKTVLMPIEVAEGRFCWGREENEDVTRCCSNFDNEGGHPKCKFDLEWGGRTFGLKYDKYGFVPKPESCLKLKEIVGKKKDSKCK